MENNRVLFSADYSVGSFGIGVGSGAWHFIVNNRVNNADFGVIVGGGSSGKYRDNIAINCATGFTGNVSAGNNN